MSSATVAKPITNGNSITTWNRIKDFINDGKTKTTINFIGNGGASISNLITFGSHSIGIFEDKQELLESISEIWTKFATGSQGFIGAIDLYQKKNLIPLIGNVLEIPIAILSSGRNLWLFRGVSQGLGQLLRVIDQREVFENGKPKIIGGDFGSRGWGEGTKSVLCEVPKVLGELISKPSNIKKLTHSLSLASVSQIIGGSLALCGIEGPGALIRNISGIGVDFALMCDENKDNESGNKNDKRFGGLNLSSWFTRAGLVWIGAAVCDEIKRLPFFEDNKGLNYLAYFFDRGASVLYTIGNLSIKDKNKEEEENRKKYEAAQKPSNN